MVFLFWCVFSDELVFCAKYYTAFLKSLLVYCVPLSVLSLSPEQSGFSTDTAFVIGSIATCFAASISNAYDIHLRVKQSATLKQ